MMADNVRALPDSVLRWARVPGNYHLYDEIATI